MPKETSRLPKETSRLPKEGQVTDGERRLDAGELELRRGREQLRLAKGARVACAVGAACLSIDCARVLLEAITGPAPLCILIQEAR